MLAKKNNLKQIKEEFDKCFGTRIICLLYYGSCAYNREVKENSDYDFCLVLDKRKKEDLIKIRNIVKNFNKIELTLHYLLDIEKNGWENFQSDNHGVFYMFHFASVKVLLGENIFIYKQNLVNKSNYISSLKRQIIEYFWRMDNAIFILNEEDLIKSDIFRKYSIRILQDILLSKDKISFKEINCLTCIEFFNKFVKDDSNIQDELKKIILKKINREIVSVTEILRIKELLYEYFTESFE